MNLEIDSISEYKVLREDMNNIHYWYNLNIEKAIHEHWNDLIFEAMIASELYWFMYNNRGKEIQDGWRTI